MHRGWFCVLVAVVAGLLAGICTSLVFVAHSMFGKHGLLLVAIACGGIGGGLTFALVGGEKYGITPPGRHGDGKTKFDPGFLGDIFIGLMTGFLGIAVCARSLKISLFDPAASPLIDLWFVNFAIAYISGFLGLRLVKAVSKKFLDQLQLKETVEQTLLNEADNAALLGSEAIRDKDYETAEGLFKKCIQLDNGSSIRGLIGLARAQSRMGNLGDAIATLDDAIQLRRKEPLPRRVAVAFFNRACYRMLADPNGEASKSLAIKDLAESTRLVPSFALDLRKEEDLKPLWEDPRLIDLAGVQR